jgi:hypothetical protein
MILPKCFLRFLILLVLLLTAGRAFGEIVLFPDPNPSTTYFPDVPWIKHAVGDDGYVRVTAEIVLPDNKTCIPLGATGFVKDANVQLVVSIKTAGFLSNLDQTDIPLATFDSRGQTGQCISPETLPLTVIPLTRLEPRPKENPGELRILLNVRSTTKTSINLVGKAQLALGAAAAIATGGAATTVAGLSTIVGSAALPPLFSEFEKYASNATIGSSRITLDWVKIRQTPAKYTIPVYQANAGIFESAAEAIERLQQGRIDASTMVFKVELSFSYLRSVFDPAPLPPSYYPDPDMINTSMVLRYPQQKDLPNLLQKMNATSPTAIQRIASGVKIAESCRDTLALLQTQIGLNLIDRTIALKALVDESQQGSSSWLSNPTIFNECFRDLGDAQDIITKLFPKQVIDTPFNNADTQISVPSPKFNKWKEQIAPLLAKFRGIMTAPENRELQILQLAYGGDIELNLYSDGWETQVIEPAGKIPTAAAKLDPARYPSIIRLMNKKIIMGGCFVWAHETDMDLDSHPVGRLLLVGNSQDVWRADLAFTATVPRALSSVAVEKLTKDNDWANFFKNSRKYSNGATCDAILHLLAQ